MPLILRVLTGSHAGQQFVIDGHDTFVVGRSPAAHFRPEPEGGAWSRFHFLVEASFPHCRVVDLDSTNGTYVNDQKVRTADLRHGDRIRAGHTVMEVVIDADEEPPTLVSEDIDPVRKAYLAGFPDVPGYEVLREIGRGAIGVVYLARPADGSPLVALKTLLPEMAASRTQIGRFFREATILKQLDHPNIVRFRDLGEAAGGVLYFAMDFVEGTDAARLVAERGRLDARLATRIVCKALKGLGYAHDRGFVHRDIKPANLLIGQEGGRPTVKLADFGLARAYASARLSGLTVLNDVGGTVPFMAPEQIVSFRHTSPAADQYAAAATLYYLLTRECPHPPAGSPADHLARALEEEPTPILHHRPELPEGLAAAITRAMSRDPRDRFAGVVPFREALVPYRRAT